MNAKPLQSIFPPFVFHVFKVQLSIHDCICVYTRCLIKSNLFGLLTLAAENNNKMLSRAVLNVNQMR